MKTYQKHCYFCNHHKWDNSSNLSKCSRLTTDNQKFNSQKIHFSFIESIFLTWIQWFDPLYIDTIICKISFWLIVSLGWRLIFQFFSKLKVQNFNMRYFGCKIFLWIESEFFTISAVSKYWCGSRRLAAPGAMPMVRTEWL